MPDERPRHAPQEFDEYSDKYSTTVDEAVSFTGMDTDYFTRVKAGYLLDICDSHFGAKAPLEVLDVGCGVGVFHPLLTARFSKFHGVDVSSGSIDQACAANPGVSYQVYDGVELPFADQSFDLVFTICVLHHVRPDGWAAFVEQMHRVLRPGGLALIFEHNPNNPLTLRAVNNCPFDADATLLKSKQAVALASGAGFTPVYARYILSVPSAGRALRKIDRLFSRVPIGAQYYVCAHKP